MVQVKKLRQLLSGMPDNFDIRDVDDVRINYIDEEVYFMRDDPEVMSGKFRPGSNDLKPWDGESERFFPNMVGIDDESDILGTNTTPAVGAGQKQSDRFKPAINDIPDDEQIERWEKNRTKSI